MPEPIPDLTSVGILTNRGLIRRPDGQLARVTRRAGAWGWWMNGTRVEPFETREEAAADFMAGSSVQEPEHPNGDLDDPDPGG